MSSKPFQDPKPQSLYPTVTDSNPELNSPFLSNPSSSSSSSFYPAIGSESNPQQNRASLYPSIDMNELAENLFPDNEDQNPNPNYQAILPPPASEELLIKIPGAILHLIDKQSSVELACGDLMIIRLFQGENTISVLARVGDKIQWPLAKDEAAVKLDDAHYFFALRVPAQMESSDSGDEELKSGDGFDDLLNYGLTFASKGQWGLLKQLDGILEKYSSFSIQKVSDCGGLKVLDDSVVKGMSPAELKNPPKWQLIEEMSAAFWTTLAPNVEDYSGRLARGIAAGTGQLIRGILWCGDVTVDRLNWGNEFLRRRMEPNAKPAEISKEAMKRVKRAKRVTEMSEKVASGFLSGVLEVSGFFTSSVVNSKVGKKFFSLLPGEIVLASLDGFARLCDAVEVAGNNVLSTSSTVTTGLVSHRYGEQAGEISHAILGTAGHAMGTVWVVFKIRKALNLKSAVKPTTVVKIVAKALSKI